MNEEAWGLDVRRPIPISPQESQVTLTVGDKLIDFLIAMGATYPVVNTKVVQKTSQSILVKGVSGEVQNHSFLQPLECQLGDLTWKHSFLYMPVYPISLLGRDLLWKLNAQVIFLPGQLDIGVPPEHTVSLQMALMGTPEKETELFPPEASKR